MKMDVKTQLHEGMKIALIDNQKEEYTLILSNTDNEMYGVYRTEIIKLNDLNEDELDTKWICTNLSYMSEEIKCVRFDKDKWGDSHKIVSFEDFDIYSFEDRIGNDLYSESEESVTMSLLYMKREDYLISKGMNYEIKIREIVAEKYLEQNE